MNISQRLKAIIQAITATNSIGRIQNSSCGDEAHSMLDSPLVQRIDQLQAQQDEKGRQWNEYRRRLNQAIAGPQAEYLSVLQFVEQRLNELARRRPELKERLKNRAYLLETRRTLKPRHMGPKAPSGGYGTVFAHFRYHGPVDESVGMFEELTGYGMSVILYAIQEGGVITIYDRWTPLGYVFEDGAIRGWNQLGNPAPLGQMHLHHRYESYDNEQLRAAQVECFKLVSALRDENHLAQIVFDLLKQKS